MPKNTPPTTDEKLILRGINLPLTAAMRAVFAEKAERLFRHEERIVRVRIDVEDVTHHGVPAFAARGHIEIHGPDMNVAVESEDAYKSVDLLVDRLDRQLRKRMAALTSRRHTDDIRAHAEPLPENQAAADVGN